MNTCDVIIILLNFGSVGWLDDSTCWSFLRLDIPSSTLKYQARMDMSTTRRSKRKSKSICAKPIESSQHKNPKIHKELIAGGLSGDSSTGYDSGEILQQYINVMIPHNGRNYSNSSRHRYLNQRNWWMRSSPSTAWLLVFSARASEVCSMDAWAGSSLRILPVLVRWRRWRRERRVLLVWCFWLSWNPFLDRILLFYRTHFCNHVNILVPIDGKQITSRSSTCSTTTTTNTLTETWPVMNS